MLVVRRVFALDVDGPPVNIRRSRRPSAAARRSAPLSTPPQRMMMAADSSHTPPSRLSEDTVAAVRDALRAYLSDRTDPRRLQAALLAMSNEARARTILPEQLLVVLKDTWGTLPEVRAMTDTGEQIRLLQRIVTMCIKEYYSA